MVRTNHQRWRRALPAAGRHLGRIRRVGALAAGLIAGGCSAIDIVDELVPKHGYAVAGDIAYGTAQRQQLDLYLPSTGAAPAPVLVYLYGGSWQSGRRQLYRFVGEGFARRGYVVAVPDYRVFPEATYPVFIEDAALAMRWLRDNVERYGGDPDRMILMGHSAGAHMAALLATDTQFLRAAGVPPTSLRGVVGIAGPYAFDPTRYARTRPIFAVAGDPATTMPVSHVKGDEPPMLLLHGGLDSIVGAHHSRIMADRIEATGGRVQYVEYPALGHYGIVVALAEPFRSRTGVFFDAVGFMDTVLRTGGDGQPPGEAPPLRAAAGGGG